MTEHIKLFFFPNELHRKRSRLNADEDDDGLDTEDVEEEVLGFQAALGQTDEGEEDDPLDAFMSGLDTQPSAPPPAPTASSAPARPLVPGYKRKAGLIDADEEEDHVASFLEARKRSGAAAGPSRPAPLNFNSASAGGLEDSDEEVYRAAGAAGYDSDTADPAARKNVEPLPFLDHAKIDYEDFARDFYDEPAELAALPTAAVQARRAALGLHVVGSGDVPGPVDSFAQCFASDALLMAQIKKAGYAAPTGIQAQVLPCVLSGRDVMGLAKTGSGKTAAYVLPLVVHCMDQRELAKGEGPIALLLAPTRELAEQVHRECLRFCKPFGMAAVAAFGGLSKHPQFKQLRKGAEVAVCTPGRMIDLLRMKACSTRRVTYVVLDEADRMFDLGFEPQVRSLVEHCRPDRQTLLFSATMPPRIEALARDVLTDPVRIALGAVGAVNADITQSFHVFVSPESRATWLDANLDYYVDQGDVIVFANARARVEELTAHLCSKLSIKAVALHGEMDQLQRMDVLGRFRSGSVHVLVATDVAARGLDIKTVRTVINFEAPRDVDTLVHRVGRTGRAGDKEGQAVTLLLSHETQMAGKIATALVSGGVPVPKELSDLARRNPLYRRGAAGGGRGGAGRGHVGGGKRKVKAGGAGLGFDDAGTGALPPPPPPPPDHASADAPPAPGPPSTRLSGFSHAHEAYTAEMPSLASAAAVVVLPAHHETDGPAAPPPPPPQPEAPDSIAHHVAATFRSQFISSAVVGGDQPAAPVVILPKRAPAVGAPPPPAAPPSRFTAKLKSPAELAAEAIERARQLAEAAKGGGGGRPSLPPPPSAAPSAAAPVGLPPVPRTASLGGALPLPPVPTIAAAAAAAPHASTFIPRPPPTGPPAAGPGPEDPVVRARAIAEQLLQQHQAQQGLAGGRGAWGGGPGGRGSGAGLNFGRGRGGGGREPPPPPNWSWGKS